jgi:hypothetical protein
MTEKEFQLLWEVKAGEYTLKRSLSPVSTVMG